MTKEKLKKEAEESAKKFFGKPTDLVDLDNLRIFKNGYLAGAEPREKRIAELEEEVVRLRNEGLEIVNKYTRFAETDRKTIADLEAEVKEWKDKADLWCKTANLKDHNIMINKELEKENAELKAQIEKLIDFVLSKTECCDVCPITDTCINSEGTCPYAGILAKGEEEVTKEWLMQFISKEIKENDKRTD